VEHYRASIIVPILSLNANITSNLGRLLAFLNTTYQQLTPSAPASPLTAPPSSSAQSSGTHRPSAAASSLAASASRADAAATSPAVVNPVEVLLVLDPLRVPLKDAAAQAVPNVTPYPSLGLAQQWDVYRLKRMIKDFQYDMRMRQGTYLRVITLSPNASSTGDASSSCHQARAHPSTTIALHYRRMRCLPYDHC
jgi:hypothetical protein